MSIVKLVGAPFSVGCRPETSVAIDQHNGPLAFRSAVRGLTANMDIPVCWEDLGDIECENTVESVLSGVERQMSQIWESKSIPIMIGGAHTITLGSLRALRKFHPNASIIYIDCHCDLMPHSSINYGSTMFYAIKEGVINPNQLAFIGVRQVEQPEYDILKEQKIYHVHSYDLEGCDLRKFVSQIKASFSPPYFITLDLDAIDPAFAPGVTCPYPVGLYPREVQFIINSLIDDVVVGLDVVELCPVNDDNDKTAYLAGALMIEAAKRLAHNHTKH